MTTICDLPIDIVQLIGFKTKSCHNYLNIALTCKYLNEIIIDKPGYPRRTNAKQHFPININKVWYRNGKLHRNVQPAIVMNNVWYQNGIMHRN